MASVIAISDPNDPRIAPFVAVRERDLVGREGRFIAEGESVLRVLLTESLHPVEAILLAAGRDEKLGALLDLVPADVPIYCAEQAVMDRIVGFEIHRGMLALGRRRTDGAFASVEALLAKCSAAENANIVVLQGITNHDNVGGLFRNAAAFGVDAILLDGESCDPLYRKALRVSVGGTLVVPFFRGGSAATIVDALETHGFLRYALSPRGDEDVATTVFRGKCAFLFGSEGPGLPDAILARTRTLRIPMATRKNGRVFDSLNVAASAAITLFLGTKR